MTTIKSCEHAFELFHKAQCWQNSLRVHKFISITNHAISTNVGDVVSCARFAQNVQGFRYPWSGGIRLGELGGPLRRGGGVGSGGPWSRGFGCVIRVRWSMVQGC